MRHSRHICALVFTSAALLGSIPAHAQLTADGITYTLTETVVNPATDAFTLNITGINAVHTDTEGGRYGVQSFALNGLLTGWTETTSMSNWSVVSGGLDAGGCSTHGNGWSCLQNNNGLGTNPLAANSSLSYDFRISGAGLANWDPSFKINWVGSQNNYNLVSQTLTPRRAPEVNLEGAPSALMLLIGALAVLRGRQTARTVNISSVRPTSSVATRTRR